MVANWGIAAHSAYDMFFKYRYLIVSFFSHLGFWSGNFMLIAPFRDRCPLIPFYTYDITLSVICICGKQIQRSAKLHMEQTKIENIFI